MTLLNILRKQAFTKKPTVAQLQMLEGASKVTASQRNTAWSLYLSEQQAESDAEQEQAAPEPSPTHHVTVKTNGFRRLGRVWTGKTAVTLNDSELATLTADSMFIVVAL